MRGILALLLWVILWLPGQIIAGDIERLDYAGVPIDFVTWSPQEPDFTYTDLAISLQRREELSAEGTSYLERLYRVQVRLLSDGSTEETLIQSRLYLTQSGVQDYGNLTFWVDSASQTAMIEQAYALYSNGRRVDVDPKAIQLVADSTDDIFTDSFQVIVPFSGLQPYAFSVLVVKTREKSAARVLPWSKIYYPQWFVPLEEFNFRLSWEEGGIVPQWRSDYDLLKCEQHGANDLHCHASEIQPYPDDPDMIYADVLPSFIVAEKITWDDLASHERSLLNSALGGDPSLEQALDKLLEGTTREEERLDRIHQFVSQKIRYVGLEHGVGGVIPRPSTQTLLRGFGDCKDKTTLFVNLARRAGFDAYPALTSSIRSNPTKLLIPAASYFDHMVACVVMSTGEEYCVDLTDPYSPYDSLSYSVQGSIRLDLNENAVAPTAFSIDPYLRTKTVETVNRFTDDGSIEEHQTRVYSGQHAVWMRANLQPLNRSERQSWTLDRYHENVSSSVDPEFDIEGIDDVQMPVTIRSVARYVNAFDIGTMEYYSEFEPTLAITPSELKTDNSYHEYSFVGVNYHGESIYHLLKGQQVIFTGPRLNLETRFGTLRRSYKVSKETVRVTTVLSMPRANIPIDDIPRFNSFMDYVGENAKIWFAIRPAGKN